MAPGMRTAVIIQKPNNNNDINKNSNSSNYTNNSNNNDNTKAANNNNNDNNTHTNNNSYYVGMPCFGRFRPSGAHLDSTFNFKTRRFTDDVPIFIPGPSMRGWRNTVEIVMLEISNSMQPYLSVFHACASNLRPVINLFDQKKVEEVSNRIPPTFHSKTPEAILHSPS